MNDEHKHYSHRAQWLRAAVLGANDGLTSIAGLLIGFASYDSSRKTLLLAGLTGLVSGGLSMFIGELVSVWSARDSERADIQKEIEMQQAGPREREHELQELTNIWINRGLTSETATLLANELTQIDVIRAHARDELGIDIDNLSNPYSAAFASGISFFLGGTIPFISGIFIRKYQVRIASIVGSSIIGMGISGSLGAVLGGANIFIGAIRVIIGGIISMGITFGIGKLL